jgi:hypothetical protein
MVDREQLHRDGYESRSVRLSGSAGDILALMLIWYVRAA